MTRQSERLGVWTDGQRTSDIGPAPRLKWYQNPWIITLAVLAVFNLIYALPRYLSGDPSLSRSQLDPNFPAHYAVLVVHVLAGNIAVTTAVLQVLPFLRQSRPTLHRWTGRLYVFTGALPSAILSLVLLPYSTAPITKLGLAMMAVLWIFTTVKGYLAARGHRYVDHRKWMLYSFALAFGTTWGRVIAFMMTTIPGFTVAMPVFFDISSWMGWVASLIGVHWWLDRTADRMSEPVRR